MSKVKISLREITSQVYFTEISGHEIILINIDGKFKAYSGVCPHLGGPLLQANCTKVIECPWHKYTFDLLENVAYSSKSSPWGIEKKKINLKLDELICEVIGDQLIVSVANA